MRVPALAGRTVRRILVGGLLVAVGVVAGAVAFGIQPDVGGSVGPGTVAIDPSFGGDTVVDLPPLGLIRADTHRGPLGFGARVDRIDLDAAGTVALDADPAALLRAQVETDLRPLLWRLGRQSLLAAVIAGSVVGLVLPRRRLRYVGATLAGSVGFVVVAGALTVTSFDPDAFDRPEFEGALAAAPDIVSTVQQHVDDVGVVEGRLAALSDRVVGLYESAEGDVGPNSADTVILHVSDLHSNPVGIQLVEETAKKFDVDAIIDTGDVTSFGAPIESVVIDRIAEIDIPYYVVPGNHDSDQIRAAMVAAGIEVLDPEVIDIGGVEVLGMGDPSFTADNKVSDETFQQNLREASEELRRLVLRARPDIVAVHNRLQLEDSLGLFPVGLAGHVHRPGLRYEQGSVIVEAGSSGATGVGAFMSDRDLPYEMQLLQFEDGRLVAVDRISFEGTDGAFRLERLLIDSGRIAGYPDPEEPSSGLFAPLDPIFPPR